MSGTGTRSNLKSFRITLCQEFLFVIGIGIRIEIEFMYLIGTLVIGEKILDIRSDTYAGQMRHCLSFLIRTGTFKFDYIGGG